MKRQKLQKAVAMLAGVMMVCNLPGVENLVETSSFVHAESAPDGAFSDGEMQTQDAQVLSQYSETDVWSSGEAEDLFSSDDVNSSPVQMVPDTSESEVSTTSDPMQVSVTLTSEVQDKKEQGKAQWIEIHAEDVSQAFEGESRVRIHLYDNTDGGPADDLEVLLFNEKQENIPETAVLPPVVLEGALNGAEELTVSRKQIYQQDENGTILLDGNGEQIVTDDYLEFTLPAGKKADFYAALLYRNQEEIYSYDALLNTEALQKVNEEWRSVLNWNESVETAVGWQNPEIVTMENPTEDFIEEDTEPEMSDGEEADDPEEPGNSREENPEKSGDKQGVTNPKTTDPEQDENISRILVTMTKELGADPEESMANEPDASEETREEDAEVFQEFDTDTAERIEETAVSGQTYAVHVQAQDLQPEAKYDSVVTIHLTDLATGLPATDVATAVCLSKEAAISSEAAFETELPEAVQTPAGVQNLKVARIQETAENENGGNVVTADYLQFTLPAGSSADFYLGLTYTTEEADYNKQLILDVKAVQYVPIQETGEPSVSNDADTAADTNPDSNITDDTSEEELLADESSAPTDAAQELLSAPVSIASAEMAGLGLFSDEQVEYTEELLQETAEVETSEVEAEDENPEDKQPGDEQEVKAIDVLAGAQMLTMMWSALAAAANEVAVYFAVPSEWTEKGYSVWANMQYGSEGEGAKEWATLLMADTGQTYTVSTGQELKVVSVDITCKYGGLNTLQFQAIGADKKFKEQKVPFDNFWKNESFFSGKLYDYTNKTWVEYIPFDPDNHAFFAGKTMYFENRGSETFTGNIKAIFYEKVNDVLSKVCDAEMALEGDNKYSVTIPESKCSYVQFLDSSGRILGDTYSNFYGQGEDEAEVESFVYNESSMCSYHYVSNAADSTWGTLGGTKVYYDAALSKLSYEGTDGLKGGDKPIPYTGEGSSVWCYVTKSDGSDGAAIKMTKLEPVTKGSNTWSDLWSADIPSGYTRIRFTAWENPSNENEAANGDGTAMWEIPSELLQPCFYGDTSDDVIYTGGNRGGYWDEAYVIRDAESGKKSSVVDIKSGSFTRKSNVLYVDSTFYDYYTDYELNGNNRDSYGGTYGASIRNWVNFRQLDQALSDYYLANGTYVPIYTGHFQPNEYNDAFGFGKIADTLSLYMYKEDYRNFISANNSGYDYQGAGQKYGCAAQGIVGNELSGGLPVAPGTADSILPYFNEDFLLGSNSKNSVLGEVYHNVSFPFTKSDRDSNGVDYWCFDSAKTTLAMRNDTNGTGYYLEDTGNQTWSQNVNSNGDLSGVDGVSNKYGFFPFNETAQGISGKNYNYGFGTKLEFKFRLTDDGTVLDKNGNPVDITFEFSGDDDVWVFVDNKLALDVGGDHGRVDGTLNFKSKTATVSNVKVSAASSKEGPNVQDSFTLSGSNTDEHTLTMFYMERGMWESNMKISFNFPDENQLQVEKQVDTSAVNPLFKHVFDDTSLFTFSIRNLATHYGTYAVTSSETVNPANVDLAHSELTPTAGNTFKLEDKYGKTNVVHWAAGLNDSGGDHRDVRYGTAELSNTIDISKMRYLEFQFYYDYPDTPGLNHMYLQLLDTNNVIKGNISLTDYLAGKTYGVVSMAGKTWVTVRIDLNKLQSADGFNNELKKIKFGYNWGRDIYLADFRFYPSAELTASLAGFTTKQYNIPDYGTAASGILDVPKGAVYSSSNGENYIIGESGTFALENQEIATFRDQFRRGSYIALKEEGADNPAFANLFTTKWTMYENGQAVASTKEGKYVTISGSKELTNVTGYGVDDGRTEKLLTGTDAEGKEYKNAYEGKKPDTDTFVFRSYFSPDDLTALTKLKVVYTNTVKTGSLKISKLKENGSEDLNGTYEFVITYNNVGGMALENEPLTQSVYLKAGESETLSGIPVGTAFSIKEVTPDDGSVLSEITVNGEVQSITDKTANGTISQTETAVKVEFTNVKKPVLNISLKKNWKNSDGTAMDMADTPDSIRVQLQRKRKDTADATFEAVNVGGEKILTITPGYLEGKWTNYQYTIEGLDQYDDFNNIENRREYEYRFVEVDDEGNPVADNGVIGSFRVTYGPDEEDSNTTVITNTYHARIGLNVVKVKASDQSQRLNGAKFTLEKLKADTDGSITIDGSCYSIDPDFTSIEDTTGTIIRPDGTQSDGLLTFSNQKFDRGIYLLTEIKAPEGYNLLKDSIVVNLKDDGSCEVDGILQTVGDDNLLTITVANTSRFDIPATGSWSRYILSLSGAILTGLAIIMYLLQKRRREGKTS